MTNTAVDTVIDREEQIALHLIRELHTSSAYVVIESYIDFAEKWTAAFPKVDKKRHDKGHKLIKKGAKLAGIGHRLVYDILSVCKIYTREKYTELASQAKENGVVIRWTHLRNLASRLKDNEAARVEIETILIQQHLTEKQLKIEIDAFVSDEKRKKATTERLDTVAASFCKLSNNLESYAESIQSFLATPPTSVEQKRAILETLTALGFYFDNLRTFLDKHTETVQQLCDMLITEVSETEDEKLYVENESFEDNSDIMSEVCTIKC